MRRRMHACAAALAVSLLLAVGGASAQPKVDLGKREFDANCAQCHGPTGKGDGVINAYLTRSSSDLTQLAKKNGGILPVARMYDVIMGETAIPSHGTRDMPAWGREYRVRAAEHYVDVPYDAEAYARARVLALVEYINRLQVK